ncbi:molybdenum cofactor biosynthesis protein MoaE [Microbacterium xanthum]|uniref:molybdenum cofactor biosynthesis protein MoaE n=1 Tax=Microbacterium xanthum TaxID=3079794 RepID=UPI002AD2F06E|nr:MULTISPECIES: molybdenum cofactor biosynthesis protein MoaE [unclassified Microbacterium]MDZ8171836.1 molybdenum cofactor biosynthesis protein MoaE [Microbacterium sp. KSW-48]MDZ8200061.1 molybdenum cofactor biosynthesis protein MoaE [Microbacterium sp. SSW1-59]
MPTGVVISEISAEPIDVAAHIQAATAPEVGALTTFVGTVRDHDPEAKGAVVTLEYSAHPDAPRILRELAEKAAGDRALVAVTHRVGALAVGDVAVVVVAASAHRAEAFAVSRDLIESIKTDLPVWKKQHQAGGTAAWVGIGS